MRNPNRGDQLDVGAEPMSRLRTGSGRSGGGIPAAHLLARRMRVAWRRTQLLRALVHATTAFALIAVVLLLLDRGVALPPDLRFRLRWLPLLTFAGFLLPALARLVPGPDLRRVSLLAEERSGDLEHLLVTALEVEREPSAPTDDPIRAAFVRRVEVRLASLDPRELLPGPSSSRLLLMAATVSALLLFGLVAPGGPSALWGHWAGAAAPGTPPRAVEGRGGGIPGIPGASPSRRAALGPLRITVTPPAYTGLPAWERTEEAAISALPGSRIEIRGDDPGALARLAPRLIRAGEAEGRALEPVRDEEGWTTSWTFAREQRGVSIEVFEEEGEPAPGLVEQRVIPLTALEDRPPEVELLEPSRDLLLATPEGRVTVRARARDDFGVETLHLGWIHSSGSGESFTFAEGEWEWDRLLQVEEGVSGEIEVDLSTLGLRAGDVLHVRASARDGNVVTGPGEGVSLTRLIRIAREEEMADATTLIGFPIDRDREPLLSQRMIILLTEELIEEAPGLDRETFRARAQAIADEQTRLKGRVEEQIFMRAAGAMEDPEGHLEHAEEGHHEEEQEEERRSEDAEAGYRAMGDLILEEHAHDSSPILGVDDNLLAAYNAMWESERHLLIAEADPSLPHQYRALEHLQTLREEDRVYARGRTRTAPVDVAGVRGEGEIDDAAPAPRSAGAALASAEAWLAEVEGLVLEVARLDPREASTRASGLAFRMLADPGGSAEAARLLSLAAERIRAAEEPGGGERAERREEALGLISRAAEVLLPVVRGGAEAPIATPATPAGARYLRLLRGDGGEP